MKKATDKYLKLVTRFPLEFIQDAEHNDKALEILGELSDRENELSEEERAYFKLLIDLVRRFESAFEIDEEPVGPADILQFLIKENGLKQADLCRATGIEKTHLSAFLGQKRRLSKDEVGRLANHFRVSPLLFVEADYFGGAPFDKSVPTKSMVSLSTATDRP